MMSDRDRILKAPPHIWLIVVSLLIAYTAILIPYPSAILKFTPNWVLLVLIHWWLRDPWRIGQGTGFFMGLMMDIAMTGILGVSALSYSLAGWLTVKFRARLLGFSPIAQGLQFLPLLLGARVLLALSYSLSGYPSPWWHLLGTVSDLIAWIPVTLILHSQDLKRSYRTP
jgi:rod shape-determining protein MreD